MQRRRSLRNAPLLLLCVWLTAGCAQEKESLHEHEHDLPAHWPASMTQAAEYIESRVQQLESPQSLGEKRVSELDGELKDLVEWSPEVAADSDLAEEHWVPIYEMSEAIRKHMRSGDVHVDELSDDFRKLCTLLLEAATQIPAEGDASTAQHTEAQSTPNAETPSKTLANSPE